MPLPLAAIGAGIGAAGGLMNIGQGIAGLFGGGGGNPWDDAPGGNPFKKAVTNWGYLGNRAGRAIKDAWVTGQLPLPMQRSLQAMYPAIKAQYWQDVDDTSMSTLREDIARGYEERGVTGPQMTQALQQERDRMQIADMYAQRNAGMNYANAVAGMWNEIFNQGVTGPLSYFGLSTGQGGGSPSTLGGLGDALTGLGTNVSDLADINWNAVFGGSQLADVPDYAGAIGNEFGGGLTFPYTWNKPSVGGGGPYNIPGVNPP